MQTMIYGPLDVIALEQPEAVSEAFLNLEVAAQQVFPGSEDPRYKEAKEVGLAVVVAGEHVGPGYLSPLDPDAVNRASFLAHNRLDHPGAWTPQDVDESLLGGQTPAGMGRFTAFALAKANEVSSTAKIRSFQVDELATGLGRVGFDGARRIGRSIVSTSGLWELHDGILTQIFAANIARIGAEKTPDSVDAIASRIHMVRESIERDYPAEVADMQKGGRKIFKLIIAAENLLDIA